MLHDSSLIFVLVELSLLFKDEMSSLVPKPGSHRKFNGVVREGEGLRGLDYPYAASSNSGFSDFSIFSNSPSPFYQEQITPSASNTRLATPLWKFDAIFEIRDPKIPILIVNSIPSHLKIKNWISISQSPLGERGNFLPEKKLDLAS